MSRCPGLPGREGVSVRYWSVRAPTFRFIERAIELVNGQAPGSESTPKDTKDTKRYKAPDSSPRFRPQGRDPFHRPLPTPEFAVRGKLPVNACSQPPHRSPRRFRPVFAPRPTCIYGSNIKPPGVHVEHRVVLRLRRRIRRGTSCVPRRACRSRCRSRHAAVRGWQGTTRQPDRQARRTR